MSSTRGPLRLASRAILTAGAGDILSYVNSTGAVTVNLGLTTAQVGAGDAKGDIISGFEAVYGGKAADRLIGDADANIIKGGTGIDILTGGGADTFVFGALSEKGDHITDFVSGTDKLQIFASGFTGLAAGPLVDGTTFVSGTAPLAGGTGAAFLYDTDDGKLFYDADGTGKAGKVLLLTLDAHPFLAASDFDLL